MSNGDKEDFFKVPEEKKVSVNLCGKTFLISVHFSMNDMKLYFDALVHGNSAKSALADVVYRKLQKCDLPIPTLDELYLEDDNTFEPYIVAVINENDDLQRIYAEIDVSLPITERFAISYRQYWDECTKKLVKAMQPAIKVMEQINRSIDYSWVNNIQQILNQYQSMISSALVQATQIAQRTAEILAPIQNTIAQFSNTFSDIIANIQIPTFTEEEKQRLEENYKAWGKLGWSVIPHAQLKLFNRAPANAKEADKIALQHFDKKGMEYLFSEIQEKRIKKEDLKSAIFCYENRQYKACALILFGIIDAKMIRLQPKTSDKNYRKVGKGAVVRLKTKFKEKADTEFFLFHMLYFSGLIECLSVLFANGEDFREEPSIINRNFIDHGMNRRSVRKKDCIQLFLALYNLAELLEDL